MTPEPVSDDLGLSPADLERYLRILEPEPRGPLHEIPVAEFWLEVAVATGEPAHQIHTHVVNARAAGTPWTRIAKILGDTATPDTPRP